jgi:predicted phosphodiesterase
MPLRLADVFARRRLAWVVAAVTLGLFGGWLGLAALGTAHADVGPVSTQVRLDPSLSGETVIAVPPVGTLVVDSHDSPIRAVLEVREVDIEAARSFVGDPTQLTQLDNRLADDITAAFARAAWQGALVATAGGFLLGLLVLRSVGGGAVSGLAAGLTLVAGYGLSLATLDTDRLNEPRFTGLLASAPGLVDEVEQIAGDVEAYGAQLARVVTHVTTLYDTARNLPAAVAEDSSIRVMHVSDLHLNPTSWDVIDAVADQFDVDVIVDSGDIADLGFDAEAAYVRGLGRLDRTYVYVGGNHDSARIREAVAEQGALVLDETTADVAGLRFAGVADPRFSPDAESPDEEDRALRESTERLALLARDTDPDVLVIHDPTYAEALAGSAPLVLSGHAHDRRVEVYEPRPDGPLDVGGQVDAKAGADADGEADADPASTEPTLVLVQGSTGGAGLRALQYEEPTPVMLSVLYLDPTDGRLQAWDDITLGGLGLITATVERHQVDNVVASGGEAAAPGDAPQAPEAAPPSSGAAPRAASGAED